MNADPLKSSDRVSDAIKLWLRFQEANRLAQDAMAEFSTFSAALSDDETRGLAKAMAQAAVRETKS